MTNLSFHLFNLQQIDQRMDQIKARLDQIHESISNDKAIQDILMKMKQKEDESSRITKEIADLAESTRQKSLKIEQSESSLYKGSIQNPKELGDLQKEIVSLKNTLSGLENEQFQKLIEQEKVNDDLQLLKKERALLQEGWDEANMKLLVDAADLEKEMGKLVSERDMIAGQIAPDKIIMYENLRNSKKRIAISAVEDESCSICGAEITAAEIQKAKSSSTLITCPSCGRILYAG